VSFPASESLACCCVNYAHERLNAMNAPIPFSFDADRNLLFGVLALQVDLIDAVQFAEVCTAWTARKQASLADLLVERGWITAEDRADVERLLARKLRKHGNARSSLAAVAGEVVHGSLAGIDDADVRHSLGAPEKQPEVTPTVDCHPGPPERYAFTRLHATGGIGRVWLARDGHLGRDVALKEPLPARASSPEILRRFLKEARITGQLEHPGIVPVYELAWRSGSGQPFYTMRFVKGRTLSEAARAFHRKRVEGREDPLELPVLLNAFVMVCNTVAYAHARSVLHRDLKGQNVVLGEFGEVVVLDWGLAKVLDCADGEAEALVVADPEGSGPDHTVQGHALGTPAYMAPEQAAGRLDLIDRSSDVYGLGAILYEILTGHPPFPGQDVLEVLRQVQQEEPARPREVWPKAPPGLEAICLRALAKGQSQRWASATELGQQVQGWQELERRQAEEALRASERRYRALAEAIPQIVWTATPDGRNDYWNQRGYEYSGLTPNEAAGFGWHAILHPDDLPRLVAQFERCIQTGEPQEIEFRLRRASDATYRWHLGRAVPVRDADGLIVQWFGTCTDIEDQKRTEEELRRSREALRASEAFYRTVIDSIPHSVWTAEPDGRLDYINQWGRNDFALNPEQTLGDGWQSMIHPDDQQPTLARWTQALQSGASYEVEFRVRRHDGVYRWFLSRAVPVRDAEGRRIKWFGTCTDIEDWKRTEEELRRSREALRASEAFYRTLIDSIQHSIWTAGSDGRIDFINRWGLTYSGNKPEQRLGDGWQGVVHPDDVPLTLERLAHALRTGEGYEIVIRVRRHDGVYRWFLCRVVPVRDVEGRIIKLFGTNTDIDDQKRAEQGA
jgi:eukaryotic-like serine/threonine-protein kinase